MATENLSWTHYFASDEQESNTYEGTINTTVANEGSVEALVTDRYNSGDGQKMEGNGNWLDTHGDHLVLHLAGDDQTGVGEAGDSLEMYGASGSPAHDDLWEDAGYTTLSPTSNKALPTRVAFSISNPGSDFPYVALGINGAEEVEAWSRNDAGTQQGPAGGDSVLSVGWHTIGIGYDGTDLYVTVDGQKQNTVITLNGDFNDLSETTLGAARLGVVGHFLGLGGDIEMGRVLVWDHELSDAKRIRAHNLLRDTYNQLSEAS